MKRFLVIGGWVRSKTDGQYHYVNASKLAELYGLDPRDPSVRLAEENDPSTLAGYNPEDWIVLRPNDEGNYKLPPGGPEDVRSQGT